jgi:MalT-like TPR region
VTYRQAIEIATVPGPPPRAAGIGYVGMAEVAYQWGELDAALRYLTEGIPLTRQAGMSDRPNDHLKRHSKDWRRDTQVTTNMWPIPQQCQLGGRPGRRLAAIHNDAVILGVGHARESSICSARYAPTGVQNARWAKPVGMTPIAGTVQPPGRRSVATFGGIQSRPAQRGSPIIGRKRSSPASGRLLPQPAPRLGGVDQVGEQHDGHRPAQVTGTPAAG